MKTSLKKSIPVIFLIILISALPFSFMNGCHMTESCSKSVEKAMDSPVRIFIIPEEGGFIDMSKYANIEVGDEITFTAIPAEGYVFSHWGGAASGKSLSAKVLIVNDTKVEAYFAKGYKLTTSVNPDGGGSVSPDDGLYKPGTEVTLTAKKAEGYFFSSWYGDASGESSDIKVTMNEDKDITALFTKGFKLSVSTDPPGAGSVVPGNGVFEPGAIVSLKVTPTSGKIFEKWSGDISGSSDNLDFVINADTRVTAHFVDGVKLNVIVEPQGGGTVTLDKPGGVYKPGEVADLVAKANDGYVFDHWSDESLGHSASAKAEMKTDRTVTAYFINDCELIVNIEPYNGGYIDYQPLGDSGDPILDEGVFYKSGTEVTIIPKVAEGFRFSHLSDENGNELTSTTVKMDRDREITAHFIKVCKLTIEIRIAAGGTVSVQPIGSAAEGETNVYTFDAGTEVTLTANPAAFFYFTEWGWDLHGSELTITFTINNDMYVTATFKYRMPSTG